MESGCVMPVNTSQTVITAKGVLDVGAIGIAGSVLGMPIDAMVLGAMAGALVNGLNAPDSRRAVVSAILVSMMLAGTFTPLLAHWLGLNLNLGDEATENRLLNLAVPVVLGGGWSWFAPLLGDGIKQAWDAVVKRVVAVFGDGGKGAGK